MTSDYIPSPSPVFRVSLKRPTTTRVGLTQARMAGARYAVGDVMIFLDSHSEALEDWLRPLLHRIKQDKKHVVTPLIDVIENGDFKYESGHISEFEVIQDTTGAGDLSQCACDTRTLTIASYCVSH